VGNAALRAEGGDEIGLGGGFGAESVIDSCGGNLLWHCCLCEKEQREAIRPARHRDPDATLAACEPDEVGRKAG
jgi:hypothetical protein